MARIKPQKLLQQSKNKKGPSRISATTIFTCNLIIVVIVWTLVATYRQYSQRSSNQAGKDLPNDEDHGSFADLKKFDLPNYAILNTSKGSITVDLHKEASPEIVDRFIDLCIDKLSLSQFERETIEEVKLLYHLYFNIERKRQRDENLYGFPSNWEVGTPPSYIGFCIPTCASCQKGHFKGMMFHRVIKNYVIQGGDAQRHEASEDWALRIKPQAISPKHDAFMLGTSKVNPDIKEFELFITTAPIPDLNDKLIVFGRVIKGEDVVQEIEEVDTDEHYRPKSPVGIINITLKQKL